MRRLVKPTLGVLLWLGLVSSTQAAVFCATNSAELQAHLNTAETNGEADTIRIAEGNYPTPNDPYGFRFDSRAPVAGDDQPISLIGGWTEFFGNRCGAIDTNATPFDTILDGGDVTRVLTFILPNAASASVTVKNLTFVNGFADPQALSFFQRGGAIEVFSNAADGSSQNTIVIENNFFIGNFADNGGALYLYVRDGVIRLINNLIVANQSQTKAGAASLTAKSVYAINNTVVGNTNLEINNNGFCRSDGICAQFSEPSRAYFANNILWDNGDLDFEFSEFQDGSTLYFYNNNIGSTTLLRPDFSAGNISVEPEFNGGFDLSLSGSSPMRDAGVNPASLCIIGDFSCNWNLPDFDLYGNSRISNGTVDIGVSEFDLEGDSLFSDGFE